MPVLSVDTVPLHITDPQAAELLAQPDIARLLKPFMRGPKTAAEVAQAQGLGVEKLHYRVQQFLRLGLLQIVGERPRRGRTSKVYAATATDFTFDSRLLKPQTLSALERGESWYAEVLENLERFAPQRYPDQIRVYLTEDGALMWDHRELDPEKEKQAQQAREAALPLLHVHSSALFLTPADASALADELCEVFRKYHGRQGPQRYGMILGLTPMTRPVD